MCLTRKAVFACEDCQLGASGIQMTYSDLLTVCCSGNTAEHPRLLQYACRLSTNIRPTAAARVHVSGSEEDNDMEVMAGVLGGRPVLALCFENMEVSMSWLQDVTCAPCVVFNGHEVVGDVRAGRHDTVAWF